jgi:hypothetical protein
MKQVELYAKVRHAVRIEGLSERAAARRFGIDPRTVAKMVAFSVPPGYRRTKPPVRPKLDAVKPVSAAYLEVWCQSYDECVVTLRHQEMAFLAGFTGQRGERTWRERVRLLNDLGFISLKGGSSGPESYALIYNPYLVIRDHAAKKTPGLLTDKVNALMARAAEIGAPDFDLPGLGVPMPEEKTDKEKAGF